MTAANSINQSQPGISGFDNTAFVGTALTQYLINCGGATSSSISQVASTGTSGQVLTSQGAGSLPQWSNSAASAIPWSDKANSFNADIENGYFVIGTATATMPALPNNGDIIVFTTDSADILTVQANTGQTLKIGSAASSLAGTAVNQVQGDSVTFVFRSTNSSWIASSVIGTWTVS